MQNDDISWILRYLDTEQGGPKKPRPGGRRHVWKSRRASGKLIRNRTVCANRSDQLFTTMPRFSRDELVEIRTLMNVGYEADEIQDQRGSRNAGNPATEAELKRRIRIAWEELPDSLVARWIAEFLPRVRAVITHEGRQIQQYFNRV